MSVLNCANDCLLFENLRRNICTKCKLKITVDTFYWKFWTATILLKVNLSYIKLLVFVRQLNVDKPTFLWILQKYKVS